MTGLKEFFEKLASDTDLQEKVKTAEDENALLKVITDAGYDVKPEELKKLLADAGALSGDDLENVAGGVDYYSELWKFNPEEVRRRRLEEAKKKWEEAQKRAEEEWEEIYGKL